MTRETTRDTTRDGETRRDVDTFESDERDAIEETRFGAAQKVFVMEEGSSPFRARVRSRQKIRFVSFFSRVSLRTLSHEKVSRERHE